MDRKLRRGFRIGAFDVEPLSGVVRGPGGVQHLQPKVMDVLLCLAAQAGELVEREVLLDQVWRRVTSEEVLTRCISELRRALSDDRGNPQYIQTVPKRGYRLLHAVELSAQEAQDAVSEPGVEARLSAEAAPEAPPAPDSAVASVAVLPFDNHSTDPSRLFLGDAFAAELHGTLARVDRLRVAARRSSFVFKESNLDLREIGARLGVDYIISGSIQCDGPHLHVIAELNDASRGLQVWAQSYDRKSEDLLSVETAIAEAIVASFTTQHLRAELHSARHRSTDSLDAWGMVQKARSFVLEYNKEGLIRAIEPLERAIALDPDYPAANATLGALLVERIVNGLSSHRDSDEAAAIDAINKALALAPEDPFVLKLAGLVWSYAGDQRKAIHLLRKAVSYAPFDFGAWGYMGWPLTATGEQQDLRDLHRVLDRLLATQPDHPGVAFWLYHRSVAHMCGDDMQAAQDAAESAVELRPGLALAWMQYANVLGHRGLKKRGKEALERCREVNSAMSVGHFQWLIRRMIRDKDARERRLGGLRKLCAPAPS